MLPKRVKVTRGCLVNSQGFIKLKCLFYAIAFLAALVSALAFARLALLNPYIGLPIAGVITTLSIFLAIKFRGKPAKKSSNNNSDDSDKGSTNNITSKEPKKFSSKASVPKKHTYKIEQDNKEKQSTNSSNDNKNYTHTQPLNNSNTTRGCYSSIQKSRIKPCGDIFLFGGQSA